MIVPPDVERSAGIVAYATGSPPCGARMRTLEEDFRVEEVLRGEGLISTESSPGSFPLYRVHKRSIDTFHLERALTAILRSRIRFAGIKDKRASAIQYFTPVSTRSARPAVIDEPNFRCDPVGYLQSPLARSMIAGNRFRIVLRECCPDIGDRISETLRTSEARLIPNYYGLQRFGVRDVRTHRIGRALIQGRFEDAVRLLLLEPRSTDDEITAEARTMLGEGKFSRRCSDASAFAGPGEDRCAETRKEPHRLRRGHAGNPDFRQETVHPGLPVVHLQQDAEHSAGTGPRHIRSLRRETTGERYPVMVFG